MNMIFIAIPITIILLLIAAVAFCWAVSKNQFNNLDYEAHRILFSEDKTINSSKQRTFKK